MTTMEVAQKRWEPFCARFQQSCHGAIANIHLERPDGVTTSIAHDASLLSFDLDDRSDPCNNNLVIEVGRPNEKPIRHVVVEPIHILLKKENGGDRYNHLRILAENGTTIMVFHPGLAADLFQKLEV